MTRNEKEAIELRKDADYLESMAKSNTGKRRKQLLESAKTHREMADYLHKEK